ncbi:hydrolase [Alteromonas sp. KC3]|uniref:dienelactone hydrolase family protein n=1 Tax=unclassified Alteromonas TaxID=2614992 RepID=UPI00192448DB|nr:MULTISPECIES: dienelactone hydrolase family protein [unclassified Alteromonas]BCO20597.1 hydrolase [Alteromonas sp. KC3]BCO24566.1 hydrolase [Alteromonas sp. KC14]
MCDEKTELDIQQNLNESTLNRRDFNKLLALGGLALSFPQFAISSDNVQSKDVIVNTPSGNADAYFVHPHKGKHPAILMWPDIKGLRPAFKQMARRLASSGYAVLVVNPFYRDVTGLALPEEISFPSKKAWDILRGYRKRLTTNAVTEDAKAFFAFLDKQPNVNTNVGAAAMGYCMSGAFVMRAAAEMPDRLKAIASFHGGGLATDTQDSPHHTVVRSKAAALHAIAENDDAKAPEMKKLLKMAYNQAQLEAEIEVYEDTLHGWCPPDSRAYNEKQADRAWDRALELFNKHLV